MSEERFCALVPALRYRGFRARLESLRDLSGFRVALHALQILHGGALAPKWPGLIRLSPLLERFARIDCGDRCRNNSSVVGEACSAGSNILYQQGAVHPVTLSSTLPQPDARSSTCSSVRDLRHVGSSNSSSGPTDQPARLHCFSLRNLMACVVLSTGSVGLATTTRQSTNIIRPPMIECSVARSDSTFGV